MDAELRAGIAIFNAGRYHAAHDAWEDRWLELEADTDDERFLHGLIQFTAAVHHGFTGNWIGLQGLAESAGGYLADLPPTHRGVNIDEVRDYLATLAADPEAIEWTPPPTLRIDGEPIGLGDLGFDAVAIAATVFAEEDERYDEAVLEAAVRYARETIAAGGSDRFVGLVFDFVTDPEDRGLVYDRLSSLVDRRRTRHEDVDGLFDQSE